LRASKNPHQEPGGSAETPVGAGHYRMGSGAS
jgi:hypothetical protein